MGNQPSSSSSSLCFKDQVPLTDSSWIEKNPSCCSKLLFENCNAEDNVRDENNAKNESIVVNDTSPTTTPPRPTSLMAPNLPALTDNLSSSEPSGEDDDDDDHQNPPSRDSNLYHCPSGSLDRDARVDLVTSRCSSGGRDSYSYEDRDDGHNEGVRE
jgi:hypothetical protein